MRRRPEPLALTAAHLAAGLQESIAGFVRASDQNLGHLETQVAQRAQELLRQATETAAQQKADATPPRCPVGGQPLRRRSPGHARTFETRLGSITVRRTRGHCKRCRQWRCPADPALGLEETAGYSPAVQEMVALVVTKMPVGEASVVLERLTGVKLPPGATLDREARRQGGRARGVAPSTGRPGHRAPAPGAGATGTEPGPPCQMILLIDAWNIRERDDWGAPAARRRQGQEPARWHWVYTGTVFRLDHLRGRPAGGRPVITERGFVATRPGIGGLRQQLHAEALRRGLGQAAGLLPRRATPGGGGAGGVRGGPGPVPRLAQAAGQAVEE